MKIILLLLAVLVIYGAFKLIPGFYSLKANKAYYNGDMKKADKFFKRAGSIFGGSIKNKISYALFLMHTGEFEKALVILNEVILYGNPKMPEKIKAKAYRSMVFEKLDRHSDALESAEEIYESAKNTLIYGLLGYLRQKDGGAELELCREAYDFNSDDRDIIDNMVVAYLRSGDLENAEQLASRLRDEFPEFAEGFYHSAQIALQTGNKTLAMEYANKVSGCRINALTTISAEDINKLKEEINNA